MIPIMTTFVGANPCQISMRVQNLQISDRRISYSVVINLVYLAERKKDSEGGTEPLCTSFIDPPRLIKRGDSLSYDVENHVRRIADPN